MDIEKLKSLGFKKENNYYILDMEYLGYTTYVKIYDDVVKEVTMKEIDQLKKKAIKELKDYARRHAR